MSLHFNWSNNCGKFFRHKLVKSIFNYFEQKYFDSQNISKLNAHAQISFAAKPPFILPNGNPPLICKKHDQTSIDLAVVFDFIS